MNTVVITNTSNAPVFVAGRLLTCGASIEAFEHEVPECLRVQTHKTESTEPELSKNGDDLKGDDLKPEKGSDELAEESLIAAAGKKK